MPTFITGRTARKDYPCDAHRCRVPIKAGERYEVHTTSPGHYDWGDWDHWGTVRLHTPNVNFAGGPTGCELAAAYHEHALRESLPPASEITWYRIETDEYCPFALCLIQVAHEHPICPTCESLRFGNFDCLHCRLLRGDDLNPHRLVRQIETVALVGALL